MDHNKAYSLLGIAYSARKLVTGEELVLKEVRRQKARLVIISEDISEKNRENNP